MKDLFLITTGGSGGHVIPATILYDHLSKKTNVIISTDKRGLRYLDKDNYKFEIIDTPKLSNIFLLPLNILVIFFLTCSQALPLLQVTFEMGSLTKSLLGALHMSRGYTASLAVRFIPSNVLCASIETPLYSNPSLHHFSYFR